MNPLTGISIDGLVAERNTELVPIIKLTSRNINASFVQNEKRSRGICRKCFPSRWYSAQMKIADRTYPPL